DRLVLAQARRFLGPRIPRRGRLHGPGQLGDLARRRLQVRLRAAHRRAHLQCHGDSAAGAVRAARPRSGARSRAGLPRRVSALANPDWRAVILGFAPTVEIVKNPDMLYLAIGIIGATVMPHNLFLHSGVVQTRRFGESVEDKREAIKLATVDSTIALCFALIINAAILILAAATFNKIGQTEVSELGEVHKLIAPLLGSAWAP